MTTKEIPSSVPMIVEYEFLGNADYGDNPHFYDMFMVEPGAPFTWPEIMYDSERLARVEQQYQFIGPDYFDFENNAKVKIGMPLNLVA